jgi:hypothetical protein
MKLQELSSMRVKTLEQIITEKVHVISAMENDLKMSHSDQTQLKQALQERQLMLE